MIDVVSKQDCVGCKACGDVCPVNAITYEIDKEGFWYPHINKKDCINCGLCEKVCPALQKFYAAENCREEPKTYKIYHKDKSIRYNSTSGALYYALAKAFIDDGGYIAGCVYNDDYSGAYHYVSNTEAGLKRIMRSKYFQSDTEGIYSEVEDLLKKGNKVLFCGTPCQVSALHGFFGKKYVNLYSVDFICRGINSPLAFSKYMEELRKKFNSDILEVHLKNKSHGWTNLGTLIKFKNGKQYYRNKHNDPWVNAFVVGDLYMRPCCATCKYKEFPRTSDITIGDFWGLRFTKEEKQLGVSVALSNSEKGDFLLKMADEFLFVEERSFKEAVDGNPALLYPAKMNPARTEFFERIQNENYSDVVWGILGSNALKRTYNSIRAQIVDVVKVVLRKS